MNETDDKNFDDELMAAAANLNTQVSPERDLWPGIEQVISQPAKPARTVWNSVEQDMCSCFTLCTDTATMKQATCLASRPERAKHNYIAHADCLCNN